MFKKSHCSVIFPTNGLVFSGELSFEPGITAVIGKNGTGKTFRTIELWRYLLFGKKALRGPASDYKSLNAWGEFVIGGVDYRVERNKGKEKLICGEEVLAVGAEAVNAKIVEKMGFGLDVFDIANASVQKESNRLTSLTPAKRKELIDEVVGLTKNEKAESDCKAKAKLLKTEAEVIRDNVAKPVEPVAPADYQASENIQHQLTRARADERRRDQLANILRQPQYILPASRPDVAALQAHETERLSNESRRTTLQALVNSIPTTTYTADEIEDARLIIDYEAEVKRRGPEPEVTETVAKTELDIWQQHFALESIHTEVTCPKCVHKFRPSSTVPAKPDRPANYYTDQLHRIRLWAEPLEKPTGKPIPLAEVLKATAAIDRQAELGLAEAELATLPTLEDKSAELAEAKRLDSIWDTTVRLINERAAAQTELDALPAPVDIAALDAAFVAARVFESQQARYATDLIDYNDKMAKARALTEEAAGYTAGAAKLVEARRELKAHLAPSLSRIASSLIFEMTCGKLDNVEVDEDMNITVNGQDVATLSGAGATAANLALRLALGRTLVGGVFPVFMGDEIDADADEERSEAMFECLRNLREQFSQVIIISHKQHLVADRVIDLDE